LLVKRLLNHFVLQPVRTYRNPFFEEKFFTLINRHSADGVATPRALLAGVSDEYLLWLLTYAPALGYTLNGVLPSLPPDDIQRNWTGATGERTMREALNFYRITTGYLRRYGNGLRSSSVVLDFGCGWGRILRFYLRDVDHENLHGCDCYPEAIEVARQQNRWCSFHLTDPLPPSGFESEKFDLIYLFSVFSHLSEAAHLAWLEEFHRLLKPGGLVVATTRPRSFISQMAQLRENKNNPVQTQGGARSFLDTEAVLAEYDAGKFCHSPSGGGGPLETSFYGESCIPRKYVEANWTRWYELRDYREADALCNQNVICVQKWRS